MTLVDRLRALANCLATANKPEDTILVREAIDRIEAADEMLYNYGADRYRALVCEQDGNS